MLNILVLSIFLSYFVLSNQKNVEWKICMLFLFIILTFCYKLTVNISSMPDYDGYIQSIGVDNTTNWFMLLFSEPYFFQIINLLTRYYSEGSSIVFFYEVNYVITLFFFCWVAFRKDISTWKKVLLFSLYYYLFSYVLLRNTIAYVLTGLLFYFMHKEKYLKISIFAFLAHLSCLPILIFSAFKNRRSDRVLIVIMSLYIIFFFVIINLNIITPDLNEKLYTYQSSQEYGKSIFHKMYFYILLGINYILFRYQKNVFFNYTYILIFFTYLAIQYISPVMGFRFSIYLIIYILLNPKCIFNKKIEFHLNWLSFLLLGLSLFNHNSLYVS
jgi:EpsG family